MGFCQIDLIMSMMLADHKYAPNASSDAKLGLYTVKSLEPDVVTEGTNVIVVVGFGSTFADAGLEGTFWSGFKGLSGLT